MRKDYQDNVQKKAWWAPTTCKQQWNQIKIRWISISRIFILSSTGLDAQDQGQVQTGFPKV